MLYTAPDGLVLTNPAIMQSQQGSSEHKNELKYSNADGIRYLRDMMALVVQYRLSVALARTIHPNTGRGLSNGILPISSVRTEFSDLSY